MLYNICKVIFCYRSRRKITNGSIYIEYDRIKPIEIRINLLHLYIVEKNKIRMRIYSVNSES